MGLGAGFTEALAIIAVAALLFLSPVIAAGFRGTEAIGLVVLLTFLTLATGVTWFVAWYVVFAFPRRAPALPAGDMIRREAAERPAPGGFRPGP